MAMGNRPSERQEPLFVPAGELARSPGHPFYERVNALLSEEGFDAFVEERCAHFYAPTMGRPSMAPGVYFRLLMVGYFEGIGSEREIAWRCADSRSLSSFLGYGPTEVTPNHSTLSKTRRLLDLETHREVFGWILSVLGRRGLLKGRTVAIDATTLEANAALRSIVRRDDGQSYDAFLDGLAKASGIDTPTREDRAKVDKRRKKKGSNDDWTHPGDPDARITKMKDGRTHLAHKVEHATDLDTTAIVSVTVQPADRGDTTSVYETLAEASEHLGEALPDSDGVRDVVLDKGYHSNDVLTDLRELGFVTYASEPDRGRRRWKGKERERDAVYANRQRIKGHRGQELRKRRAEVAERSNAHCYESGGLRYVHVRRRDNVEKRVLIQAATYNLALMMRALLGVGTPKGLTRRLAAACSTLFGARGTSGALERFMRRVITELRRLGETARGHTVAGAAA
jgi:transposase